MLAEGSRRNSIGNASASIVQPSRTHTERTNHIASPVEHGGAANSLRQNESLNHIQGRHSLRAGSADGPCESSTARRCSSAGRSSTSMSKEELRSLLIRNPRSKFTRDTPHRLDPKYQEDRRELADIEHRYDPELFPSRKLAFHDRLALVNRSRVFDAFTESPAPTRTPVASSRSSDGLGSLARFIYSDSGRDTGSGKGKRHFGSFSSGRCDWLFGSQVEGSEGARRASSRGRQLPKCGRDKLGSDLIAIDSAGVSISPRPAIRTKAAVEAFEAAQPELSLPQRKRRCRFTEAMRTHSAHSDNDIFGVRMRREYAMRNGNRPRSVLCSEPFGGCGDSGSARHVQAAEVGTSTNGKGSDKGVDQGHSNPPFGNDEACRSLTPTRKHNNHNCGNNLAGGPCNLVSPRCFSAMPRTPRGRFEEPCNLDTFAISPRARTGRARVPGCSVFSSNVVFGDASGTPVAALKSVRRVEKSNSSQIWNALMWR